jgi:hypothetical protein
MRRMELPIKERIYMFNIFDLLCGLSEIIRGKNEKTANIFDTIVGHIFMILLTGGLWLVVLMITKLINKRKQKRA